MLHEIATRARLDGYKAYTVLLVDEMPGFAQVVAALLGDGTIDVPGGFGSGPRSEADYLEKLLAACSSSLSSDRKYLLAVDRGETLDQHELRMLGTVAVRLADSVSIVVGYQTDEPPEGLVAGHEIYETVDIGVLDGDQLDTLLKSYFGVSAVPADLREELHSVTGGNPGFLSLMLNHLWSARSVRMEAKEGVLEVTWDTTMGIPGSVRDVMQEKLAALSPGAKELLTYITVGVGHVETSLLQSVLPDITGDGAPV
jgi:hypothetical protein